MISNYLVLDTGMHGEAIATATDTISSISTENANYKILVEDLAEKLILQERQIGELKRKCNISICFFETSIHISQQVQKTIMMPKGWIPRYQHHLDKFYNWNSQGVQLTLVRRFF